MATCSATPFRFPRDYDFPPFFTRQVNLVTHHAQLVKWSNLILSYCRHHRLFRISLSATSNTSTEELFYNRRINKRLSLADAREVIDFMRRDGRAEGEGDVVWVHWHTSEEWAALIQEWVDETAQRGTVLTLYELTEGDATRGRDFHGLDPELLQRALGTLVKRGKAQIFGNEDSQGVKFF